MDRLNPIIEQVGELLDDVPETAGGRLARHEWTPLRGTLVQRLLARSADQRAHRRAADEAMRCYDGLERQLLRDQKSDRAGALKRLANAKGFLRNGPFTVRYTDEIAGRWSRRLAAAISARAVAERMRQLPIERAAEFGAPGEGLGWLRSAQARNLREASVLVVDVPKSLEHTWYSKITGLIGPHSSMGRIDFESVEDSLGRSPPLPVLAASIAAAEAHERRILEPTLPTVEAILDQWRRARDGEARFTEVRDECKAEKCVRTAEVHIARMRRRSAVISRVRATTRSLIAEVAMALDASPASATA